MSDFRRVAQLRNAEQFSDYLNGIHADIPFDDALQTGAAAPLAQSLLLNDGREIGNRFCILPMEGWDGTPDGLPTDLTRRRWSRFGLSGAKLIWGGEAVAVRHDGRANPDQLMLNDETEPHITALRDLLVGMHAQHFETTDDLYIGLQLTHSGRFARPNEKSNLEPRILYRHPILDERFGIDDDSVVMTDDEIKTLIDDFVAAAVRAQRAGFDFVDIKHCHGYLGHEFLSAYERPGDYGGSFENRTRFLCEIVAGIRSEAPGLAVGMRVSAFDWLPFKSGADGTGEPETYPEYPYNFGGDATGTGIDYTEMHQLLKLLASLDIQLVCVTAGSPYYNPHIQRPALFPPSDGYQPPEDPLVGVARQIGVVRDLKAAHPTLTFVGSAYSYLQEWLPNVAQALVRQGWVDSIGLGRMALSYPDLPADVLAGNNMQRKQFCRTFSDCTTAPRNGMISGCYPLDEFYKEREEFKQLAALKKV